MCKENHTEVFLYQISIPVFVKHVRSLQARSNNTFKYMQIMYKVPQPLQDRLLPLQETCNI